MTKGLIFNIQHFSLDDGPGIRTTVFFKGCPLHCAWCHNPESLRKRREIAFHPEKCVNCGYCVSVCPDHLHRFENGGHVFDRSGENHESKHNETDSVLNQSDGNFENTNENGVLEINNKEKQTMDQCSRCVSFGVCTTRCYTKALEVIGEEITAEDVMEQVLSDKMFYDKSGGGMTLSGGEPLAQPLFAIQLAKMAKDNGLHVCLETCGYCSTKDLLTIQKYTDLFLFDYKHTGDLHKTATGVSSHKILKNLAALDSSGAAIILRCPMIPDVNITQEHIDGIVKVAKSLAHLVEIHLLPYHPLGLSKSSSIGMKSTYANQQFLTKEDISKIADQIHERTAALVKIL